MIKKSLLALAVCLATSGAAFASTNLVTNGTFDSDANGWTLSGDTSATGQSAGMYHFGSVYSDAYLTQQLNTTSGGQYVLSFDLYSPNYFDQHFGATFGGQSVYATQDQAFGWTHFSFNVSASGNSTALVFNGYNSPSYYYLDNVSVTAAVPEPATGAMALAGLAALGLARRRQRAA